MKWFRSNSSDRARRRSPVCAGLLWLLIPGPAFAAPLANGTPVRGWTILSDSRSDDLSVVAAARGYGINHLELSDHLCMELRQLRTPGKAALVNELTDKAHAGGIGEVVVWDHALYDLQYYPKQFRTGPGGTIDFDNPGFWVWLKADYRALLDQAPHVDGLVLTFVDTGAKAEEQSSSVLKTPAERLAAVVNAVADVVVGERHLNLYARTLASSRVDKATMDEAVRRFRYPEIRLMAKAAIEDFFLTTPYDPDAGMGKRPTLIEFDAAGEMNGQGIIANTWPEYFLAGWRAFRSRPSTIGYTARVDRYGSTRLVGHPGEIDLLALKMGADDAQTTDEDVYRAFITAHYGPAAAPDVEAAFRTAFDVASCALYTLGNCTADHSHLEYEPFDANYINYAAGKWREPSILTVGHGVNREFQQWRDVIEHIAPAAAKDPGNVPWYEVPWVLEQGWVRPGEAMDEEYLRYVVTEKDYGVARALEAVAAIERARPALSPADYAELQSLFARTLLTAQLHAATAKAYYGFRVWCRGGAYHTAFVESAVRAGLAGIASTVSAMRAFNGPVPSGQWNWAKDADIAELYSLWVTRGWPRDPATELEAIRRILPDDALYPGFKPELPNPNAGRRFSG